MLAKFKPILVITRRELIDQFRDWRIILPIIGLTLFFPALMNFTARQAVDFIARYGAELLAVRFIPFMMMITGFFPMTVSLVIGLESFAGEAERKTIEPLLSSPLTDHQLYLGKLIASLAFPLTASYLGLLTYLIGFLRNSPWLPEFHFLMQIFLLTTVQALVMVSAAVVISTQTTSVRAANLLSSFIVIPMALLIQAEAIIIFWGNETILWWVIFGEFVTVVLLVRMGLAHFNREDLLGREIDVINIRSSWNLFKTSFIGGATSIRDWFRFEIVLSVQRLAIPLFFMTVLMATGLWIGINQAAKINFPAEFLPLTNLMSIDSSVLDNLEQVGLISFRGVVYIWLHNLRVVVIATLLGIFSFGVLGALVLMLPMGLLGFLSYYAAEIGLNPLTFLAAFIVPHGIFEIPAIIISGALIFRVGATLVTPTRNGSIGEAWIKGLADWARVMIVVIIPLFFTAALLEAFVTPRFMIWFLGR